MKVNQCLICGASLQQDNIDYLAELMVDDIGPRLADLGERLHAPHLAVEQHGAELIADMAASICLACYLIQGKASVERTIDRFVEENLDAPTIPGSALIKLERVL